MDLKALQKEEKFILTQKLNCSCHLVLYYQQCHFQLLTLLYPQKKKSLEVENYCQ